MVSTSSRIMSPRLELCILALCLTNSLADDYGNNVVKYTKASYSIEVPTRNTFVMFFAPWCGHCKRLAPTWDELGSKYNVAEDRLVTIAKVDCTADTDLCSEEGVTGYPTLKYFPVGKDPIRFKGPRDLETLEKFIKEQIGTAPQNTDDDTEMEGGKMPVEESLDGPKELDESSFHKHIDTGLHFVKFYAPWCGHCQKLAPIWDMLADSFEDSSVSIAKIDCMSNRAICTEFEIQGYPTLLWIQDGKLVEKYQGARGHDDLKNYVEKMKTMSSQTTDSKDEKLVPPEPPAPVLVLTNDNFKNHVDKGITFVKYFAPWCGHCKRLAPTWEDLARKLTEEKVSVAEVDCTRDKCKNLCQEQKVEGYPTMILYKNGKRVKEYSGSRDLDSLIDFVMGHLKRQEL